MNQTILNANTKPPVKFWRRQFQEKPTTGQTKFDWLFGVIMPAICFLFDPIIFKGGLHDEPMFGKYKPSAYILSYFSILALMAFLLLGKKTKYFNAFFAGLFLTGGIISLIIGVILSPISLIGLVVLIGALGFTPLFTAFVYLRNTFRAFQTAKPFLDTGKLWKGYVLTAIFSFVFPVALNFQIERIFSAVANGNAETVRANARTLRIFAPIINPERLLKEYRYSDWQNLDEKQQAIAELYKNLTGKNADKVNMFTD